MMEAHLIISGKVQGVWYRASTQKEANKLGLKGWVRNLPTGEVEAIVQGEKETVEKLIAWCNEGPPAAEVSGVDVKWAEISQKLNDFKITD